MSEDQNTDIPVDPPVLAEHPDGTAGAEPPVSVPEHTCNDTDPKPVEGCEGCAAEMRHPLADHPLFDEVQRTISSNHRRMLEMASAGIRLKDADLLEYRIELLVESILPQESMERLVYEARYASEVSKQLDKAESEIAMARLAGRLPTGPQARAAQAGLIVPGQR